MCIDITGEFPGNPPRAGHKHYQRAYKVQPFLFATAQDGFHGAIGDTIAPQ
jgi:hypothetical protein